MKNQVTHFRNIVVFNWNSKNNDALQQGVSIAKQYNAALTVVEIFDSTGDTLDSQVGSPYSSHQTYLIGRQNPVNRGDTYQAIQKSGIAAERKYMMGGSHQQILEAVKHNDYDLVILGASNFSENIGIGTSTLVNLVRRCPVALWIVKPGYGNPGQNRILAAVDPAPGPGPFADSENVLNKQILQAAAAVAKPNSSPIDIVHCWLQPMEDRLRRSSNSTERDIRNALNRTRRNHQRWLKLLLDSAEDQQITSKIHLLKGKPHLIIPDLARKHHYDLVIMGNMSRAGVNGLFVGNTAEKILCRSDVSLLIVKPLAFFETTEHRPSTLEADCVFA
jgi:nucleotide-binding universal stress UspA family protein